MVDNMHLLELLPPFSNLRSKKDNKKNKAMCVL